MRHYSDRFTVARKFAADGAHFQYNSPRERRSSDTVHKLPPLVAPALVLAGKVFFHVGAVSALVETQKRVPRTARGLGHTRVSQEAVKKGALISFAPAQAQET